VWRSDLGLYNIYAEGVYVVMISKVVYVIQKIIQISLFNNGRVLSFISTIKKFERCPN